MARSLASWNVDIGWHAQALCVGEDPELFFPLVETAAATAPARAVCRRCPVLIDCRDWAVHNGETDGVWGATTPSQRRALRRAAPDS
ncbi:WhiB family transcriptional regulator [Streptomyces dubilierae]|uniref:Transcriptional regulator WhiB n=1 Tax=Streptomyces dubilierae TaxID=3075533 RepID=A0ABU2PGT7_9ACTN|nr:WhiB family transcriptional regulator [Streptomyces sp. DSM 41921]MDT0390933.1 WhiB family transcriptional regulator [Streptomyces sp. DSM 41921]